MVMVVVVWELWLWRQDRKWGQLFYLYVAGLDAYTTQNCNQTLLTLRIVEAIGSCRGAQSTMTG